MIRIVYLKLHKILVTPLAEYATEIYIHVEHRGNRNEKYEDTRLGESRNTETGLRQDEDGSNNNAYYLYLRDIGSNFGRDVD
jgi:hypothetical protein